MKNFRPDLQNPLHTAFPKCSECGTIHPVTPPGGCPMALGVQRKDDKINKFLNNITTLLYDHEDNARLLEMLGKTIRAWQLQWHRKKTILKK